MTMRTVVQKWMGKHSLSTIHASEPRKILFFGTDDFAVKSLDALRKKGYKRLEVVLPAKVKQSGVFGYAREYNIPFHRWKICSEYCTEFDVGVVASFGHLIPKNIIDSFSYGMLNVHPSILPRWRGPAPILHSILQGDSTTGVSIMSLRPFEFDNGPILYARDHSITQNMLLSELTAELAGLGAESLLHVLENIQQFSISSARQGLEATSAPKVTKEMFQLNWVENTARQISRQYRALGEIQALRTVFKGQLLSFNDMIEEDSMNRILDDIRVVQKLTTCREPGRVSLIKYYIKKEDDCNACDKVEILCVRCHSGYVGFKSCVYANKKMSVRDLWNGYLSKCDEEARKFESSNNGIKFLKE